MNITPHPCLTAHAARELAASKFARESIMILHSPHADNKSGDYYVVSSDDMVRSWETVLFTGKGSKANS